MTVGGIGNNSKDLDKAEYLARRLMPLRTVFVRIARPAGPLVSPRHTTPHVGVGIWAVNVEPLKKILLFGRWDLLLCAEVNSTGWAFGSVRINR